MYVNGYGDLPYAASCDAAVTLASGSRPLTKTVTVSRNLWNRASVQVSAWPYRDHAAGIPVGYNGVVNKTGAATRWYPHFRNDDVGYTT
jgi:hypothetical protein